MRKGYSDALLGIFDVIAPAAASALGALTRGDTKTFHDILAPTVPLSRHIFKAPTRFYKTGVVFMAYLNGLQDHFTLVGGQESARSTLHLAELFRLADAAGLLADPDRAAGRMRARDGGPRRAGVMRDLSNDRALLSINSMTVKPWSLERAGRGLRPRRHFRDLALARHRAGLRRRARGKAHPRARNDRHRPCAAAACFPPPTTPGGARRSTTTGARSTKPPPSARSASFSSSAGCRRARATSATRARAGARRARRAPALCAASKHAARDRAAASDVRRRPRLREHARARQRSLRRAGRRRRRRGRHLSRLVGSRPRAPDRARRRSERSWPTTSTTGWCRPPICCSIAA